MIIMSTDKFWESAWLRAVFDGMRRAPKHQAPNTKLQKSSKSQVPNQGPRDVMAIKGGTLRFGAWNLFGGWSLGFEASQATENTEEPSAMRISGA